MKSFLLFTLLAATAATTATTAHARALPALTARVVDEAGVLDASEESRIDRELASYEQRTGHQMAVVVLRGLDGDSLEDLSMRTAEQWRLGDAKRDDGLLLMLAMHERSARIEVGYGLEGVVTDALASRVIRDVMAPQLVNGHVALALEDGLDVLMKAAEGEATGLAPRAPPAVQRQPSWVTLAPIALFLVVMIMQAMARRRRGYGFRGGRRGMSGMGAMGGGGLLNTILWSSMLGGSRRGGNYGGGGFGGGGGGFGGGGGGFGGGGASGRW